MDKPYRTLVSATEARLARHGDNHLGVGWPNQVDAETRYRVHLEVIRPKAAARTIRLLDLGCGASALYGYMRQHGIEGIGYSGLDLSEQFIELSRAKYPEVPYYCLDILDEPVAVPTFDYVVMNGVLTEKRELSFEQMLEYAKRLIPAAFDRAEVGISFNVMSKHVDWERDDLFHLPFDVVAAFLTREVSRNFVIRNDYGLYEYTVYVYR